MPYPTMIASCIADNYIDSANPTTVYSAGDTRVFWDGASRIIRSYYKFNFPTMPAGNEVKQAILYLPAPAAPTVAYTIIHDYNIPAWSEASLSWSNAGQFNQKVYGQDVGSWQLSGSQYVYAMWVGQYVYNYYNTGVNNGLGIGNGLYSPPIDFTFCSKESSTPPYIEITYGPPNRPPNAPVITSPAWGSILTTLTPTVSWTFSDPDQEYGDSQGTMNVQVVNFEYNTILYDSPWVVSPTYYSWQIPEGIMEYGKLYYIRVRVKDSHDTWNTNNGVGPDPNYGNVLVGEDKIPPIGNNRAAIVYSNQASTRLYVDNVSDYPAGIQKVVAMMNHVGGWVTMGNAVNGGGGTWYYNFNVDNEYTEKIRECRFVIYDNNNNVTGLDIVQVYYDTTPPVITNKSPTQSINTPVDQTYRIWANVNDPISGTGAGINTGIDRVIFQVYDLVYMTPQQGIQFTGIHDGNGQYYYDIPINQISGGAEGQYAVWIKAYDRAGNAEERQINSSYYLIDRTSPSIGSVMPQQYINANANNHIRIWAYNVTDNFGAMSGSTVHAVRPDGTWYQLPGPMTGYAGTNDWYYMVTDCNIDGNWRYDIRFTDMAGNTAYNPNTFVFRDTVRPADPNPQVNYTGNSAIFTWNAFSDPIPSSGRKWTKFYLGEWDGNAYVGTPLHAGTEIGDVTTFTVNNLPGGKTYRYTVTYHDNADNESFYTYKTFQTKKQIGTAKVSNALIPIYEPTPGLAGNGAVRATTKNGTVGAVEIVPTTDSKASAIRVRTSQGIQSIAKL